MSTIASSTQSALSQLGLGSAGTGTGTGTAAASSGTNTLGQKDFLTLLTAQLQNQDPLNPIKNSDFIAQLAQFSTVSGISQVNSTLSSMSSGLKQFGIASATNLLGHEVLVPGALTRPDAGGTVAGEATLPEAGTVTVTYTDPATGKVLSTQDLGSQPAGKIGFGWSGVPSGIVSAHGQVQVSVKLTTANGTQAVDPSVYARVLSAQAGQTAQDMTLHVEDYGAVSGAAITSIR